MNRQKLSGKEAALIAAARASPSGRDPAALEPGPTRAPGPAADVPSQEGPGRIADAAVLDERLAQLMQTERERSQRRTRRMRAVGAAIVAVAALPIMAWGLVTLVSQIVR